MQSFDPSVPKAMLTVAGRPFADWHLRWPASEGVVPVVYSIGYIGEAIREFVGAGERWGLEVEYVEERWPLGTRGRSGLQKRAARSRNCSSSCTAIRSCGSALRRSTTPLSGGACLR